MTKYEVRFYEDFHKFLEIQNQILEELKKLNEPMKEDKSVKEMVLVEEDLDKIITQ